MGIYEELVWRGLIKDESSPEIKDLLNKTCGTLGAVVLIITMLGMLLSPVLTAVFGFGWFQSYINDEPDGRKFIEASYLLKITFPYLFFITLTALTSAVLNVFNKFLIPAITPCVLNIVLITTAFFVAPYFSDSRWCTAVMSADPFCIKTEDLYYS